MKTIGYIDKADGNKTLHCFMLKNDTLIARACQHKRFTRISKAFAEIRHLGNINIYFIKGNKTRFLFSKGY